MSLGLETPHAFRQQTHLRAPGTAPYPHSAFVWVDYLRNTLNVGSKCDVDVSELRAVAEFSEREGPADDFDLGRPGLLLLVVNICVPDIDPHDTVQIFLHPIPAHGRRNAVEDMVYRENDMLQLQVLAKPEMRLGVVEYSMAVEEVTTVQVGKLEIFEAFSVVSEEKLVGEVDEIVIEFFRRGIRRRFSSGIDHFVAKVGSEGAACSLQARDKTRHGGF
ncbi:hypothetical protein C8F01DRAFT_1259491 [Mycena amicta]|nr:hypothetical protein C8F01DRAFT_1259491 [Mycena amicta]